MKKVQKKPLQNLTTAIQMLYLCSVIIDKENPQHISFLPFNF